MSRDFVTLTRCGQLCLTLSEVVFSIAGQYLAASDRRSKLASEQTLWVEPPLPAQHGRAPSGTVAPGSRIDRGETVESPQSLEELDEWPRQISSTKT